MLFITTCFSHWEIGEGTLIINFGDSARRFVDLESEEYLDFNHTVILKNARGFRIEREFSGTSAAITVPAGRYTVSIKASDIENEVRAFGIYDKVVDLKAGRNELVNITMHSAMEVFDEYDLRDAIDVSSESPERQLYILIGDSFNIEEYEAAFPIDNKAIIIAEKDVEINCTKDLYGALFHINTGGTLYLGAEYMPGTITINGNSVNSLIRIVDFGAFIMHEGITLKGSGDSCVFVSYGTFTMHGGNITGNTAEFAGGGVYVSGGTFTMHGGNISGNHAQLGGGVIIYGESTFTMEGGNITGNTASHYDGDVIIDGSGGGVCVEGDFIMKGGNISGNTAYDYGGGVLVVHGGVLTMENGTISGNSVNGHNDSDDHSLTGGVGGGVSVYGTFNMKGGTISGNTAVRYGGGVYIDSGTFSKTSGTINGHGSNNVKDEHSLSFRGHAIFAYYNNEYFRYKNTQAEATGILRCFYNQSKSEYEFTGEWEGDDEVIIPIYTQRDLQRIGTLKNNEGYEHFILMENIVLTGYWTPISIDNDGIPITFDGNNKTISNLRINSPSADNQGLFSELRGSTIKNLGLINVNITGKDNVGGIVGNIGGDGTIENCYVTGVITGEDNVGGIVGANYGDDIENCYFSGNINGSENVGGIVGFCSGKSIKNCYVTGNITGSTSVGGIVGDNVLGSIVNCYSTGDVSGSINAGGIAGKNIDGVENCVALNPTVSIDETHGIDEIGRVVGGNNSVIGSMSGNKARSDMKLNGSAASSGSANDTNGENVNIGSSLATVFTGWDQTIWNIPPGNLVVNGLLPTLKTTGGTQNPVLRPVP